MLAHSGKGKHGQQLHESGEATAERKASDAMPLGHASDKPSRSFYKVIFAILLLAALLAFAVYSLAVAAIVCRIRDWKQQQKLAAPEPPPEGAVGNRSSDDTNGNNSQVRSACHVTLSPFSNLLNASTAVIIIVNSVAALVLLESLLLLPIVNACGRPLPAADKKSDRVGSVTSDDGRDWVSASSQRTARDSEAVRTTTATAFALSDMEPCQQHTNDFILRLTYKTRCRDHLVLRVSLPTTDPASSSPGSPRPPSGLTNETLASEAETETAESGGRSDWESIMPSRKSGISSDSGMMQENGGARPINPSVRWMTGTDVQRVNETARTGSCERRASRKSRAIQ